jgi:hypothetical protein
VTGEGSSCRLSPQAPISIAAMIAAARLTDLRIAGDDRSRAPTWLDPVRMRLLNRVRRVNYVTGQLLTAADLQATPAPDVVEQK